MNALKYESAADIKLYNRILINESGKIRTRAHFHDSVEIMLVTEGVADVNVNSVTKSVGVGDLVVCNSFDIHSYDGDFSDIVLIFASAFLPFYGGEYGVLENFIKLSEEEYNLLTKKIYEINKNFEVANVHLKQSFILEIIGELIEKHGVTKAHPSDVQIKMKDVLLYIDEHFNENLTLEYLADKFAYSKNYFSYLFNGFTGMSLSDYLGSVRVQKIIKYKKSLKEKASVSEILEFSGFNSAKTYYRALSKFNKKS